MTNIMTNLVRAAVDVPLWTAAFVARHALVVAALAAVPVAERTTAVLWAASRPAALAALADIVTLVFRLLLLAVVIGLLVAEEPWLRDGGVGRRLLDGAVDHWPALLTRIAVFILAFALLNLAASGLGLLVDGARATRYDLVVFAFRNAVIIPLAVVWMCGIARQLLLSTH
ncbi:hypothetical protein ABNF97_21475 [Plantactinospora sp. B6F1]|uniref:hypothetical protein n=1 Tax=Plantactinospora sp. B6F1 TaxID=3158971 RepID=UPI0032D94D64